MSEHRSVGQVQQAVQNGFKFGSGYLQYPNHHNPFNAVKIGSTDGYSGSGTLVADRWVLTAAHVAWHKPPSVRHYLPKEMIVALPKSDGTYEYAEVKKVIPRSSYLPNFLRPEAIGVGDDIAVLELRTSFDGPLAPIVRIDDASAPPDAAGGFMPTVAGYGLTDPNNPTSGGTLRWWEPFVQNATSTTPDMGRVANTYPPPGSTETFVYWPNYIMRSVFDGAKEQRSLEGDSGGPHVVWVQDPSVSGGKYPRLVGVTSYRHTATEADNVTEFNTSGAVAIDGQSATWVKDATQYGKATRQYDVNNDGFWDDVFVTCGASGPEVKIYSGKGAVMLAEYVMVPPPSTGVFPPCDAAKIVASFGGINSDLYDEDLVFFSDDKVYSSHSTTSTSGGGFALSYAPADEFQLGSSGWTSLRVADINGTSVAEVVVDRESDGAQKVLADNGSGLAPITQVARRVTFADFDGDGKDDSSFLRNGSSSTDPILVDYYLTGYQTATGGSGKALGNVTVSWTKSLADVVRTHVGNFNGDISAKEYPINDYLMEFNGKLCPCMGRENMAPICDKALFDASSLAGTGQTAALTVVEVQPGSDGAADEVVFEVAVYDDATGTQLSTSYYSWNGLGWDATANNGNGGWPSGVTPAVALAALPTDHVLVLDHSGSMSAQDFLPADATTRLAVAVEGAEAFVDAMDPLLGHRVAVVSYGTDVSVLTETFLSRSVTDLRNPADPLKSAFSTLLAAGPNGWTSIGGGFEQALSMLVSVPSRLRRKSILLLTDGRQNRPPCLAAVDAQTGLVTTNQCDPGTVGSLRSDDARVTAPAVCILGMGLSPGNVDEGTLVSFSDKYLRAFATPGWGTTTTAFTKCLPELDPSSGDALDPNGFLPRSSVAAAPARYPSSGDTKITFLASWMSAAENVGDVRMLVSGPDGRLIRGVSVSDGVLRAAHQVQRVRVPAEGGYRFQLLRAATRIVDGFASNAFFQPEEGIELVRRQIQRLCPEGCARVAYFEDGRVGLGGSVYAEALAREGSGVGGSGLLGTVDTFTESTAGAFGTALGTTAYDLIVHIHQLTTATEPYDTALRSVLCNTTTPAILFDSRVARLGQDGAPAAWDMHGCSGAMPTRRGVNYPVLLSGAGTMLDADVLLANPGYDIASYSFAAAPFDELSRASDRPHLARVGATQLEVGHDQAFYEEYGGVGLNFGAVVSFSADQPYSVAMDSNGAQARARRDLMWSTMAIMTGVAPLRAVVEPTGLGQGVRLAVALKGQAPAGGFQSSTVTANVVYPTVGLDTLAATKSCPADTSPAGDSIYAPSGSVALADIPVRRATYTLNDSGTGGDAVAGDGTWSVMAPELGAVTGTITMTYLADLTYSDPSGMHTAHREAYATQYVGPQVYLAGTPCPGTTLGGVVFVDAAATGAGNGTSWENAYTNLQDGIDVASMLGVDVWVKAGTYAGQVYEVREGVRVYGGFAASLTGTGGNLAARTPMTNRSIIDGQAVRALAVLRDRSQLDGFTLQNAQVVAGGAVYVDAASATLSKCEVRNNALLQAGAVVQANGAASLAITDTVFRSNSLLGTGGTVQSLGSSVSLTNVVIINQAAYQGAAINNALGNVTLLGCTLAGGSLLDLVASVFNTGTMRIENSILWHSAGATVAEIANLGVLTVRYSDVRRGWAGTGNLNTSPSFVNVGGGDVHLAYGSACLDAADGDVAPPYDLEGAARVDDPSRANTGAGRVPYVDLGAYERH